MNPFSNLWSTLTRYSPLRTLPVNEDINVTQVDQPYQNHPDHPASTFIQRISYEPNSRIAFVRMGNSTYYYPMTERQLGAWLRSKSLGQWYNKHLKLT